MITSSRVPTCRLGRSLEIHAGGVREVLRQIIAPSGQGPAVREEEEIL